MGHVSRLLVFSVGLASLVALTGAASAEEAGRYQLEKSGTGYVRMDTRTGEMSKCDDSSGQLICRLAADERSAFQDDVDRLQSAISSLEKRVADLEARPSGPQALLPSEDDFQKSLSYMERFFRSFMGIVKDIEKDAGEPEAGPQKT